MGGGAATWVQLGPGCTAAPSAQQPLADESQVDGAAGTAEVAAGERTSGRVPFYQRAEQGEMGVTYGQADRQTERSRPGYRTGDVGRNW